MPDPRDLLVVQYKDVAKRYAQVTQREPPPLVADLDGLRSVVAQMLEVIRGERHHEAGQPVAISDLSAMVSTHGGGFVTAALHDHEGKAAGTLTFSMPPSAEPVVDFLRLLRKMAEARIPSP